MNFKVLIVTLLFGVFGLGWVHAQISDRLMPHFGAVYSVASYTYDDNRPEDRQAYFTLGLGSYYLLAHKNDVMSVGVDGNLNFGFSLPGGYFSYFIQPSAFLMGRVGGGSTPYNQQKIGFGAGVGLIYTYSSEFTNPPPLKNRTNASFFNPGIQAEVVINTGGSPFLIRGFFAIGRTPTTLKQTNSAFQSFSANASTFGFGLVYGL